LRASAAQKPGLVPFITPSSQPAMPTPVGTVICRLSNMPHARQPVKPSPAYEFTGQRVQLAAPSSSL